MKNQIVTVALLLMGSSLYAQGNVRMAVETNNKELQVLRENLQVQQLENKEGNALPNPEVEFGYQWGVNDGQGDKKDLSVTQELEWATILGKKRSVSSAKNAINQLQYETERRKVMLQTDLLIIDLVYNKIMTDESQKRWTIAQQLEEAYQKLMERGEATSLDYNKARLNLLKETATMQNLSMEREKLESQLKLLNGGNAIEFLSDQYPFEEVIESFDSLWSRVEQTHPRLLMAEQSRQLSQKEYSAARAEMAPNLKLGYAGEWTKEENYQGLSVGLALPLWANRNKVKTMKANQQVVALQNETLKESMQIELKSLYAKMQSQKNLLQQYQSVASDYQGLELSEKAMKAGKITLLEYLMEQNTYLEMVEAYRAVEREYWKSVVGVEWY